MSKLESFNGPDFINLDDGRTDYAPESGVGPEGTFSLFEQQMRREELAQKMSGAVGKFALEAVVAGQVEIVGDD